MAAVRPRAAGACMCGHHDANSFRGRTSEIDRSVRVLFFVLVLVLVLVLAIVIVIVIVIDQTEFGSLALQRCE
jgi:hypothetical protein